MPEQKQRPQGKLQYDVIVVGAGLAGSAAAATAARGGLKVALVERGQTPGGKNYFGGTVYTHAIAELYPDFMERKPPFERPVTEAGFWFLSPDGLTKMTAQGGHLNQQPPDAYVSLMTRFNGWWTEQAQKEGVFLIPKTTVMEGIRDEKSRVIGVRTDRPQGDLYAPVTIICEGVNNLVTQRMGLINHDLKPETVALGCKQLISLPAETIQARFGLPDANHGLAVTVMGDVSLGLTGMGFLYTGLDCVSVGLGVNLNVLQKYAIKPYELLQHYLSHPQIAPLIAGGRLMEYGAHLIPEGGYRAMPRLAADGVMVAGDAAAMVNAIHWEGTNMAIVAGKTAGETAVEAHRKGDFSESVLKDYRQSLEDRFVLKDLYQYRNLTRFLETHPDFMEVYPNFLNEALGSFLSGFGKPKNKLYADILHSLTEHKSLFRAAGDIVSFGRTIMGR
jgi:electron transfer flavoprotein-quinone oxidoreductase